MAAAGFAQLSPRNTTGKGNELKMGTALDRMNPEALGLEQVKKMISISGRVTDPAVPEPGCPFAPRCEFATERCRENGAACPQVEQE